MLIVNRDGTKREVHDEPEDFEAGDVVLLNSGSRKMTIERIHEGGAVDLVWFHDERVCRAEKVAPATLHHIDDHTDRR